MWKLRQQVEEGKNKARQHALHRRRRSGWMVWMLTRMMTRHHCCCCRYCWQHHYHRLAFHAWTQSSAPASSFPDPFAAQSCAPITNQQQQEKRTWATIGKKKSHKESSLSLSFLFPSLSFFLFPCSYFVCDIELCELFFLSTDLVQQR